MVLSKSVNGKVEYWDPETLQQIRTFYIKNTASNQCRFDVRYEERINLADVFILAW